MTVEILFLKRQTAGNIIEIGKRLIAAKEMVGHGNWLTYLETNVQFSRQTAERFMNVATEFANCPTLSNLEPSKVYVLLEAPPEERERLAAEATDMSARELQEAVRAANAARKEADEFKRKLAEAESRPPKVVERTVEVTVTQMGASDGTVQREVPPPVYSVNRNKRPNTMGHSPPMVNHNGSRFPSK